MHDTMRYDLHTHTTASDGALTPESLIARAIEMNVSCVSITDHDTVDAFTVLSAIEANDITVIPGIELSTTWSGRNIHILGLNVDPENTVLLNGVRLQKQARIERAHKIASRLRSTGISDLLDKAIHRANGATIGRPHFAEILVEEGAAANLKAAFRKYLGNGKPGDVRQYWADMVTVIDWIHAAGGTPALAHPGHYKLTNSKLRKLAKDFVNVGGQAIEVCNGMQSDVLTSKLAVLCNDLGLMASCGSDFHNANNSWSEVGKFSPLPKSCNPVWESW